MNAEFGLRPIGAIRGLRPGGNVEGGNIRRWAIMAKLFLRWEAVEGLPKKKNVEDRTSDIESSKGGQVVNEKRRRN